MTNSALMSRLSRRDVYRLSEDLADEFGSQAVAWPEPGESGRDERMIAKLGVRGWGRLHHFRHFYPPGWGEGGGKPLSPRAVDALDRFLVTAAWPDGVTPSLFLTDRGGVELAWEDRDGSPVQVEFYSNGVELYRESTGLEETVALAQAAEICEALGVKAG